ncbi:MAG: hypothetical protein ACI9DC_000082 [Gammaproteobacteria bacterium]|jgi:hypothetical protein
MELTEIRLPNDATTVRRLDIASDGMIWYVNSSQGGLGRYNPATGEITEWPSPSGPKSHPNAIAVIDGIVWYNESRVRPDALVRFDSATQTLPKLGHSIGRGARGHRSPHVSDPQRQPAHLSIEHPSNHSGENQGPIVKEFLRGTAGVGVAALKGVMLLCFAATSHAQADLQLYDTHIHYSHDAWEQLPPPQAVAVLREAGLQRAFVSSSSDEGTQKLYALAPDLIVPVLRPYRRRGELRTWFKDDTVPPMLGELMRKNRYAGIGEFHIFGADADSDVMRAVVKLARQHHAFLHAHADADAVRRLFAQDPEAVILWAHSGFVGPAELRTMLAAYPNLWSDLAFRSEHASGAEVDAEWRALFAAFPDRFMLGTDTFAPERWYFVAENAKSSRRWLGSLPPALAERIASGNAQKLLERVRWGN